MVCSLEISFGGTQKTRENLRIACAQADMRFTMRRVGEDDHLPAPSCQR